MIQDFEISITAVGSDQYLVRTEHVEKGVQLAEEKVHWPVAQWLENTKSLMHDPLLGLLQGQQRPALPSRAGQTGTRVVSSAEAITLVNLGRTLHNELFKGQLHDSWVTAQGVAQKPSGLAPAPNWYEGQPFAAAALGSATCWYQTAGNGHRRYFLALHIGQTPGTFCSAG